MSSESHEPDPVVENQPGDSPVLCELPDGTQFSTTLQDCQSRPGARVVSKGNPTGALQAGRAGSGLVLCLLADGTEISTTLQDCQSRPGARVVVKGTPSPPVVG